MKDQKTLVLKEIAIGALPGKLEEKKVTKRIDHPEKNKRKGRKEGRKERKKEGNILKPINKHKALVA